MDLDLANHLVVDEDFDYALTISTADGVSVRIETPMVVEGASRTPSRLSPDSAATSWWDNDSLVGLRITSSDVATTGTLTLTFSNDLTVMIEPDDDFESWSVTTTDGNRVLCAPGGEIIAFR